MHCSHCNRQAKGEGNIRIDTIPIRTPTLACIYKHVHGDYRHLGAIVGMQGGRERRGREKFSGACHRCVCCEAIWK